MTVASDESYRDPTNLQGKLQKHEAFEAELTANSEQVNAFKIIIILILSVWEGFGRANIGE